MANKHKNRANKETGDRQVRRSRNDYSMSRETALKMFEASNITVKEIGKQRLSTHKPVRLSAIDKNRFETQSKLGKGFVYILGNGVYLEFSIGQKIKRVCIAILDKRNMLLTPNYSIADLSYSVGIGDPRSFYDRLCNYAKKYGYSLELT